MSKRVSLSFMFLVTSLAVCLTFMITYVYTYNTYNKTLTNSINNGEYITKLEKLDSTVRGMYIGTIDDEKLADSVLDGYMKGIGDKYAEYMPKSRYQQFQQENVGLMVGIGVRVVYENTKGVIEVIAVMPDSPAEKGGMLPGDCIYKVGDEFISDIGYYAAVEKIKGLKGTEVTLTILRGENYEEEKILKFLREEVIMNSVEHKKINDDIGYIRITEFNKETPDEFISAINDLQKQEAQKYIFDLRNNPGGDLEGIKKTLDFLLPTGPIIRIVYKDGHEEVLNSDANEFAAPMIVLINGNTASAAELFSSALRDYNKATLIGTKTYGKGTMQTITPLGDGSAIRVSQYMYNPPYGDNYEGKGVEPNIEVDIPKETLQKVNFYKLTLEEDTQLSRAIEEFNK